MPTEYSSFSSCILIVTIFNIFLSASVDNSKLFNEVANQCQCVPFHQCNSSQRSINGIDIIDIRFNANKCPNYLDSCCNPSNIINQPNIKVIKKSNQGCGFRNKNGMGFQIENSIDEAQFGEFPWIIAIFKKSQSNNNFQYHCGGSLIDSEVVLTAAHCVYFQRKSPQNFKIRAGEWDMQNTHEILPHQEIFVKKIIVHNEFYSGGLFHDIAILILEKPIEINDHISTICLANSGTGSEFFGVNNCFACGWGESNFKTNQKILKKIQLPIIPTEQCVRQLRETNLGKNFQLHRTFLCAGGQRQIDTCKGDGGSPLVCPIPNQKNRFQQIGIVSWGIGCGQHNVPGVYVNIPVLFNWIDDQLYYNNYNLSKYPY